MNVLNFIKVIKQYNKCPKCNKNLQIELQCEVVKISCDCGFIKYVDENNRQVYVD